MGGVGREISGHLLKEREGVLRDRERIGGEPGVLPGVVPLITEVRLQNINANTGNFAARQLRRTKTGRAGCFRGLSHIPFVFCTWVRWRHVARTGRSADKGC